MTAETDKLRAEQQRKEFEAWAKEEGFLLSLSSMPKPGPTYAWNRTEYAWEGWKAAMARPIEVTDEMVERGTRDNWSILLSGVPPEERDSRWEKIKAERPRYVAEIRDEVRSVLSAALKGVE